VLIESGSSRVLVDAGFAPRTLEARLAAIHVPCESIEAVVVTHEHSDHVKGACAGAARWGWALYASAGTLEAYPELRVADARSFDAGGTISLGRMDIATVITPHDAADPVAVVATEHGSGVRAAVAYDLGHATLALRKSLAQLDLLVLEANHDDEMLRAGPYPPSVRRRIGGRRGHLSNHAAAAIAQESAHAGLAHLVLAHLSDRCNTPELARSAVTRALATTRFRGAVHVARQDAVVGPFTPKGRRVRLAQQLELAL
jgi:phosphoribosyl 1,2-cyclic phosphodiesterase